MPSQPPIRRALPLLCGLIAVFAALAAQTAGASPYSAAVADDAPSAYWRLGEASGACAPAAAAGSAGALTAGTACIAAAGALRDAGDDDNGAQHLTGGSFTAASSSATALAGAFTLEAWIDTDTVGQQGIIEKYTVPGPQRDGQNGYGLRLDNANKLMGFVCDAASTGTCQVLKSPDAIGKNAWHLVDFVVTGSVIKLFVDGVEVAAATQTQQATAGTGTLKVGAKGDDATAPFHGDLDEVALYPSALSAARVRSHYVTAGYAASPYSSAVTVDSPSAYWRLDETGSACTPAAAAGTAGSLTAWGTCSSTSGALRNAGDADDGAQQLSAGTYFTAADTPATALTGAFTLEAWINTNTVAQQGIIEKYDTPGPLTDGLKGYGLRLDTTNKLMGFVCNSNTTGNCQIIKSVNALAPGAWHLVDYVVSGSTVKLYVDTVEVASATQTRQATAGTATLKVGAKGDDATSPFQGDLDEVALYPSALAAGRIQAHYTTSGRAASPYSTAVVLDSPTAYWRLGEASGACSPAATTGTAGALTATDPCVATSGALLDSGDAANGAQQLGGGAFTASNGPATALSGALTAEAWINTDTLGQQGIVEKYASPGSFDGYGLRLDADNKLMGFVCGAVTADACQVIKSSGALSTHTWYLVDFAATGSTINLYINGVEAASAAQTQPVTPGTGTLKVGAKGDDGTARFEGSLDEVALYPRGLSAARVQAHYAASGHSAPSPYVGAVTVDAPAGYWRLDEPSGGCSPATTAGSAGALTASAACVAVAGALQDVDDAGNGAQLLGSGAFFTGANSAATALTGGFTVEAWIDTDTVGQQGIVEKYSGGGDLNGFGLRLDATNKLMGFACNAVAADGCQVLKSTNAIATGAWHLVDFVSTGTTLTLYVDGAQAASIAQTQQATAGAATLKVGAKGDDGTFPFHGGLDEVALYPSPLTAARVAAHYTAAAS